MNNEKCNLTWHTFTDNIREMLYNLMYSNELTDVTLVSDDKKQFKAHKIVLSASSPVFKSIISDNNLSSPIIYLRGIQSHEIESILQFIYLGQATFYQDRMDEFLNVAKNFGIREISNSFQSPGNEQFDNVMKVKEECNQTTDMEETINVPTESKDKSIHKQRLNNDNRYPCHKCNYIATKSSHLQTHIKSIHEGFKYPCDQCTYKATERSALRQHVKSIHEKVKYPCNQCNYMATQPSNLRHHKKSVHSEA